MQHPNSLRCIGVEIKMCEWVAVFVAPVAREPELVIALAKPRFLEHAASMQVQVEKRALRRFEMRVPAFIRLAGGAQPEFVTETKNVSAQGLFFYIDRPLEPGSVIEVTTTFPPYITLTEPLRVRFTARVIRTESAELSGRVGVGASIEKYEFLAAGEGTASAAATSHL
jgi:hypothetical protein